MKNINNLTMGELSRNNERYEQNKKKMPKNEPHAVHL